MLALVGTACHSAPRAAAHPSPAVASSPSPSPAITISPSVAPAGPDRFDGEIRAYLASRQSTVSAAVFDAVSGQTYAYDPGSQFDTASVAKVAIMAAVLRNAESEGRFLTETEASDLMSMIESSDNDAATALWQEIGGRDGMRDFIRSAGLPQTSADPAGHWGLTQTTALDQVKLFGDFVFPNRLLSLPSQAYGLSLLRQVIPMDYWGVSGGVPIGVRVALKNGWLPTGAAGWVINSVGYVRGKGRNYVIAVLSNGNPSFGYGVQTIDQMSAMVWQALGP